MDRIVMEDPVAQIVLQLGQYSGIYESRRRSVDAWLALE